MDLSKAIQSVQVLNIDESESTISAEEVPLFDSIKDSESFIISDADEELIILIEFNQFIDLQIIKMYALPLSDDSEIEDASAPHQVHVYRLNTLHHDFDDIKGLKPDKSIKCSTKKLVNGQTVNLQKKISNPLAFRKMKFLAVFIESNQNHTELTYLHGISLKGTLNGGNAQSVKHGDSNDNAQSEVTLRKIEDPNTVTAYDQLNQLSVKELTQYLQSKGIDPKAPPYNCIEKGDLVKLVLKIQKEQKGKEADQTEQKQDE